MTEFMDDSTFASDPGNVSLSMAKLRKCCPILFRWFFGPDRETKRILKASLAEYLAMGDSRAAVVVSTSPLLVAAYTDEFDCVAMLAFPPSLLSDYGLQVGTRLLTVNVYMREPPLQRDIILGPNANSLWFGFRPNIAEFLSDDVERIEARKRSINEDEWQRAFEMGMDYMREYPGVARDGNPLKAGKPAKL